jgi:hypothetical protein
MTRSAQIDHLLSQSITFLSGVLCCKAESTAGVEIHQDSSCSYSQVCFSLFLYMQYNLICGATVLLFCTASSMCIFL